MGDLSHVLQLGSPLGIPETTPYENFHVTLLIFHKEEINPESACDSPGAPRHYEAKRKGVREQHFILSCWCRESDPGSRARCSLQCEA